MNTTNPIAIPFSKTKTILWLIGALAFVFIGCWLLFGHLVFSNTLLDSILFTKIIGIIALLFFGLSVYYFVRNLIAKGSGLIIDDTGIQDFSTAASAVKIYWKDVVAIEVLTIKSQPLILFKVSNPQAYIDAQPNRFKRKMLAINYKWYGAPVGITANGLKISFEELLQLVNERFEAYAEVARHKSRDAFDVINN